MSLLHRTPPRLVALAMLLALFAIGFGVVGRGDPAAPAVVPVHEGGEISLHIGHDIVRVRQVDGTIQLIGQQELHGACDPEVAR